MRMRACEAYGDRARAMSGVGRDEGGRAHVGSAAAWRPACRVLNVCGGWPLAKPDLL